MHAVLPQLSPPGLTARRVLKRRNLIAAYNVFPFPWLHSSVSPFQPCRPVMLHLSPFLRACPEQSSLFSLHRKGVVLETPGVLILLYALASILLVLHNRLGSLFTAGPQVASAMFCCHVLFGKISRMLLHGNIFARQLRSTRDLTH